MFRFDLTKQEARSSMRFFKLFVCLLLAVMLPLTAFAEALEPAAGDMMAETTATPDTWLP